MDVNSYHDFPEDRTVSLNETIVTITKVARPSPFHDCLLVKTSRDNLQ